MAAPSYLLERPVLWFWLGEPPPWVPANGRAHSRWRDLLEDVKRCLGAVVDGTRLAPNRGLLPPSGPVLLSPALEALVASSPSPVHMSAGAARGVRRLLRERGLSLALSACPGGYVLEVAR